jgi:hypothetical protein
VPRDQWQHDDKLTQDFTVNRIDGSYIGLPGSHLTKPVFPEFKEEVKLRDP